MNLYLSLLGFVLATEEEIKRKIKEKAAQESEDQRATAEKTQNYFFQLVNQRELAEKTLKLLIEIGAKTNETNLELIKELVSSNANTQVVLNMIEQYSQPKNYRLSREEWIRRWKMFNAWIRMSSHSQYMILQEQFDQITPMPELMESEIKEGYTIALCYGFMSSGKLDYVKSAEIAWHYMVYNLNIMKDPKSFEIRSAMGDNGWMSICLPVNDATKRLVGFYWVKINPGFKYKGLSAGEVEISQTEERAAGLEMMQMIALNPMILKDMILGKVSWPIIGALRIPRKMVEGEGKENKPFMQVLTIEGIKDGSGIVLNSIPSYEAAPNRGPVVVKFC